MVRIFYAVLMTALLSLPVFAYSDSEPPTFEEFPGIQCDTSSLAKPNLRPGTREWMFRTRIQDGSDYTCVNFNGAFTLLWWGCGSPCQMGFIVDRTDGAMYELPTASGAYDFRADSSLLIVNPVELGEDVNQDAPDWSLPQFYEFRNGSFVLLYQYKG